MGSSYSSPVINKKLETAKLAYKHKHYRSLARLKVFQQKEQNALYALNRQIQGLIDLVDKTHPTEDPDPYNNKSIRDCPTWVDPLGQPLPFPSYPSAKCPANYLIVR
jgi:hypothetical protein